MTIGTIRRADGIGNDTATTYPYGFKIFAATDLEVKVRRISDGSVTTLVYPTQFTVTGVGIKTGGNVVLSNVGGAWQNAVDGTLKTGYVISIRRAVAIQQVTDIRNQGGFFPDVHEDEFDYLTMIDLAQQDAIERAPRLDSSYDPATFNLTLPKPVANQAIGFNSTANGLALISSLGAVATTAFTQSLLANANTEEFLDTLLATLSQEAAPSGADRLLLSDVSAGTWDYITLADTIKGHAALTAPASGDKAVIYDLSAADTKTIDLIDLFKEVYGSWALSGDISPAQIAANQNDYNPTGLSTAAVIRVTTDAERTVTGLAGGADGRVAVWMNVGATNNLVLANEDAASTAANRFALGRNRLVPPGGTLALWYDSISSRWRPFSLFGKQWTVTRLTSGSGTYNPPTGSTRILADLTGGGGGGAGGFNGTSGGSGGNTTFGSFAANGGGGGGSGGGTGGAGGTVSAIGSSTELILFAVVGGQGGPSGVGTTFNIGGNGGTGRFGGEGSGGTNGSSGTAAATNSGAGGGGGGVNNGTNSGAGGGSGGSVSLVITAPAASYSYAVGASGAAGTGASNGGAGGSGHIYVIEFYD